MKTTYTDYRMFEAAAKARGLTVEAPHADAENGPSPDDLYQTLGVTDVQGDLLGWWNQDEEGAEGVLFDNATDAYHYMNDYTNDSPDGSLS